MTFEELIKEKTKRLEKIPLKFQTFLEKEQARILKDVLGKLNDLSTKGGYYEITAENINTIASITDELKQSLISKDYLNAVKEFTKEFDLQATFNDKIIKAGGLTIEDAIASNAFIALAKKSAIEALVGAPIDKEFIKPIQSLLEISVINGAKYSDTVDSIKNFVLGTDGKDSKLLKYSKQITTDSFALADASYTSIVSDIIDAEWFYYSGTEMATTRCFCKERYGKFFYYKEIESWGNGENLGDCDLGDGTWSGEIAGTNESTIYTYRGGYMCGHYFMPVTKRLVPQSDIDRAESLGYL